MGVWYFTNSHFLFIINLIFMAEQERKTFKWGDQEYLLDDLLKLHAA
jgi:hypothetical protein